MRRVMHGLHDVGIGSLEGAILDAAGLIVHGVAVGCPVVRKPVASCDVSSGDLACSGRHRRRGIGVRLR